MKFRFRGKDTAPLIILSAVALLAHVPQASAGQAQAAAVVLEGARLIDGTGRPPTERSVLVIEDDTVRAAGTKDSIHVPKGVRVLNLSGKTIVPALIDLHCHLALTRDGLTQSGDNYTRENIAAQLQKFLNYGIGTVVSLGTDQDLIYELREAKRAGRQPGARLYTAGRGFGVPGGYPPALANAQDRYRPETAEQARAQVRELAAQHPDFVKIWVDDNFGRVPKMKPEIYRAIISEAHRQGLRVIAHVFYLADAQALVDAGVDGLGHSIRDQPVSAQLIAAMKAHGVIDIPTLVREESSFAFGLTNGPAWRDDPYFQRSLAPGVLRTLESPAFVQKARSNPDLPKLRAALDMAEKNLKTMFESGAKVAFGTDAGPPLRFQGYLEHRELQLMVESGLSPLEVLVCATHNSAEALGQGAKLGTLEPGKYADFLVLDSNPLDDIRNTEKLSAVWQAGKPVQINSR
jgi:imidazolonepropionase-like amidohydrolase